MESVLFNDLMADVFQELSNEPVLYEKDGPSISDIKQARDIQG